MYTQLFNVCSRVLDVIVDHSPLIRRLCLVLAVILMMHGYGDSPKPLDETMDLMEDMVIDYMSDIVQEAMVLHAKKTEHRHYSQGNQTIDATDILFLIRKDKAKVDRAYKLIDAAARVKEVKKPEIKAKH